MRHHQSTLPPIWTVLMTTMRTDRMRSVIWKTMTTLGLMALLNQAGVRDARAQGQAIDPTIAEQPSATLLLPYFQVDLNSRAGITTIFTINNSSATAILAHVTVWSDLAVPVFNFNVYLTGFDMQT